MTYSTPSVTMESYEVPATGNTSSLDSQKPGYKRKPSFNHGKDSHDLSGEGEEGLLLKIDHFLVELERRLEYLESYGNLNVDSGFTRAYSTLQAVQARCSQVSGEFISAGRKKAKIMVETVESRYHNALVAKKTLHEKAFEGIGFLESMLTDFENKAHKMKEKGFVGAAGTLMDGGRRVVDEGFERAKKAAESVECHIQAAILRAKQHGLISYEDLPVPWRVNPHITKGYRFTESKVECVRSMFDITNESVNIWSHAIGLLIVLSIAFYYYPTSVNFSMSTKTDIFITAVFFFAACKCLVCSTMWHTMNSVADQCLMERFACVDYTGISLLIAASIMTTEYTAFYCEPIFQWGYLSTTAILGIGGVILPWHPTFNRADMAWARVAFYMTLGGTGFAPAFHLLLTRGTSWAWEFYAPIIKSLLVYTTGAFVYASQIPEKWYPGAFDYIGGSHNLWHFAVLFGILFHYVAMQEFFACAFERAINGCGA